MKKSKPPKKSSRQIKKVTQSQKWTTFWKKLSMKRKILLFLAAALILGAIIYFSYAWYQGYTFKKVEKKMDALTQEIIAELGEPVSQTKERSCGYSSDTFRRGRLSCGSISELEYKLKNPAAEDYIQKIRDVVKKTDFSLIYTAEITTDFLSGEKNTVRSNPSDTINEAGSIRCTSSYAIEKSADDQYLSISIGCFTDPLRPIYPVKD